jgi:hypothetical protein
MANPPPPYDDITGISRTVMKDNAQESVTNYNGNARPGEMVVDLTNNNVYIGNVNGGLELISTGGGSGNAEPAGSVGAIQLNAGGNLFGASANLTFVNNTLTTGNITPAADNIYFLGNATNRWANIWLGPGTLYITDSNVAANTTAELSVLDGVLQINGAAQLQVGQLKFVDNTIESTTGNIDIEIGQTASTADLVLRRNTVVEAGKTLTVDGNPVATQIVSSFDPQFRDVNNTFVGGTVTGTYVLQNRLCYFSVNVEFTGTTNYGNSQYQITLPFPAASNYTTADATLHQIGGGGGSGANTTYHIAGHLDSDDSDTTLKLFYSQTASDLQWKFNVPGGVPPGNVNAYWAVAGDAHFDINGTYLIA